VARPNRRKSKPKKVDHSQRMSQLKAKALAKVAGQAWGYNLRYKTITLLQEALRRDPKNPDIILQLATACGKQRHYEKAEELLARLVELAPRKASLYRRVGQVYSQIDRPERAVECYRRSLELNSDTTVTVPTLLELANIYERRHKLDDARAVVADALAREPANEQARLQQAVLDRRRGEVQASEADFRAMVADETLSWPTRVQSWYELAQLLDDSGRYEESFNALVAAKQLKKRRAAPYRQQNVFTLRKNQELLDTIDKAAYDRWRALAEADTAYRFAVLTSHPRSGTTLIEQVLDSHEQLKSADEFDVFSQWVHNPLVRKFPLETPLLTVLEHVPPAVRQQARATYWKQTEAIFDEPIGDRMLLDKNPGMMIFMPFINWAFPEMKMLIAIRDPRDVVLSCFMQKVTLSPISANWLSFADTATYYARVMKTWLKVRELTPSPWLEFRYEDVVRDLESQARRILEFLGLPWDDKVLKFYEHAREKIVRSPTYKDVTQPVYHKSVGRWRNYARHFEPVLDKLQPFIKEFGYATD
jgi:tetratricopeptide (TPR) repeat protein